jgi:DNA-binding MarR family transcriptional regulator
MPLQTEEAQQITVWREFNRFYTARLGLLRGRYMGLEFSLTESRLLYELLRQPGLTATDLRGTLELDAGYISRLLSSLTRRGLIVQSASSRDAREKLLTLTSEGLEVATRLDVGSAEELQKLLDPLDEDRRGKLLTAITTVREILRGAEEEVRIVRASRENLAEARLLLSEYYEAIQVVVRDTPAGMRKLLTDENGGIWIAYVGETPAGCVVLRPLPSIAGAAECKRLYVRPQFRGKKLAKLLMEALEAFATGLGLTWVYLDTKDDLEVAIEMYYRRGYEPCERYNDNPQATIFLRKALRPA